MSIHPIAISLPRRAASVARRAFTRNLVHSHWNLIGHRSEVSAPGEYLRLRWHEEDEVVIYNDAGNLIAFDNVCPHRGTKMLYGRSGTSPLTCPYHGWTYREGKMRIPREDTFSEAAIQSARLTMLSLEECGGFLFACSTPKSSLRQQLGDLFFVVQAIGEAIQSRIDFNVHPYDCDWTVATDNALEDYHLDKVHRDTLGKLHLLHERTDNYVNNSMALYRLGSPRMDAALKSIAYNLLRYAPLHDGYFHIHLFPFGAISGTYGTTYALQNYFPNNNRTLFSSRVYSTKTIRPEMATALRPIHSSAVNLNRKIFREDADICRRIERSFVNHPDMYSSTEHRLKLFHSAIKDAP